MCRHITSFLCLLFLFSLTSCHFEKDISAIVLQDKYDIITKSKTEDRSSGFIFQTYIDSADHIITVGICRPANQLVKYDETKNIMLDSFDLSIKQNMEINQISLLGKDSALVAFNTVYDLDFQDAALLFVDRKAQVLDTVVLEELPIRTHKHVMYEDPHRYHVFYWDFPLVYRYNKVFVPLLKWNEDGTAPASFIGYVSKINQHYWSFTKLPIACSKTSKNHYWSFFYSSPRGVASSKDLYVIFPNSPILYKYSFLYNKTSHKKIRSSLINKISPYQIGEEAKQFDPYKSKYEQLYYDSLNNRIYLTARLFCDSTDGPLSLQRENFIYTFMMLDENMNVIGEGLIPEGYSPVIIPYKEGFLLLKKNCMFKTYTYFVPFVQKKNVSFLTEQITERRRNLNNKAPKMNDHDALTSYLKSIVGSDFSHYSGFLILSESSCLNCVPTFTRFFREYKDCFLDKAIAVVLINQDEEYLRDFISQSDGVWKTSEKPNVSSQISIYCDTNQTFQYYFMYWVNARFVKYDPLGSISTDTIVNPSALDNVKSLICN